MKYGLSQELAAFDAAPSKALEGPDAAIYRTYKYAAIKCPATEDPRASLRGFYTSRVADGVIKFLNDNGISPKVYDAVSSYMFHCPFARLPIEGGRWKDFGRQMMKCESFPHQLPFCQTDELPFCQTDELPFC